MTGDCAVTAPWRVFRKAELRRVRLRPAFVAREAVGIRAAMRCTRPVDAGLTGWTFAVGGAIARGPRRVGGGIGDYNDAARSAPPGANKLSPADPARTEHQSHVHR
jgi:hypothetical protein